MGEIACYDSVGFAAIGYGRRHAESQFMFARYTSAARPTDAILLTYVAKKRAEVAPGVGMATDMFIIASLGTNAFIDPQTIGGFDEIYKTMQTKQDEATEEAKKSCLKYLEGLGKQPAKEQSP